MDFGNWLKCQMDRRRETAYRLAKELNVSQSTVANWLNDKTIPQRAHAGLLADHYGCDANEIFALIDN